MLIRCAVHAGLSQPGREPSAQPVSKLAFDFERRKLTTDEVSIPALLAAVFHFSPLHDQALPHHPAVHLHLQSYPVACTCFMQPTHWRLVPSGRL